MEIMGNEDFVSGNYKHCINGYLFSNLPGLTMTLQERVRWFDDFSIDFTLSTSVILIKII